MKKLLLYFLTHIKTITLIVLLFGVMCLIGFIGRLFITSSSDDKTEKIISKSDIISSKFELTNFKLDSLSKVAIKSTMEKIQYFTKQQENDKRKLDSLIGIEKNNAKIIEIKNGEIGELIKKLGQYDLEVNKLKNQLIELKNRINKDSLTYSKIITPKKDSIIFVPKQSSVPINVIDVPDDNSLVLKIDGTSKKHGPLSVPENLNIYLIPLQGNKRIKELMIYDIGCGEIRISKYSNTKVAKFYGGSYFFNNVPPGKYLVKICYYYGNFKIITKTQGQQVISILLSPPIQ